MLQNAELNKLIADLKHAGKTAIQVQQYLRENNIGLSWIETLQIYNSIK